MMSRAKKKKAHVVELNEPLLREKEINQSDQAK
jgi:hypothetical protein